MLTNSYKFWLLDKGVERWLDYAFPNHGPDPSGGLRVIKKAIKDGD